MGSLIIVLSPVFAIPAWAGSQRQTICHVSKGAGVGPLEVGDAAVRAHLGHGDYLPLSFYADADGDGFGDPDDVLLACAAPDGAVDNADDCDDQDASVSPEATDACGDGVDGDCSGDDALCFVETDGWRVTSGRVRPGPTAGTIIGDATFERLSGVATRGGGACLVADLFSNEPALANYTCATSSDCAHVPRPAGGSVYCASPDGSGEPRRCWTRPSDNCTRSPSRSPGTFSTRVVTDNARRGHVPVRWMVLTCMADAADPAGCANTRHVYTHGPTSFWSGE